MAILIDMADVNGNAVATDFTLTAQRTQRHISYEH
jgi:hypothetical protein